MDNYFENFDEENIDFEDFDDDMDELNIGKQNKSDNQNDANEFYEYDENDGDNNDDYGDNDGDDDYGDSDDDEDYKSGIDNDNGDDEYNTESPDIGSEIDSDKKGSLYSAKEKNNDINESPYFGDQSGYYVNGIPNMPNGGYDFDYEEFLKQEKEFKDKSDKIKRIIRLVSTVVFAVLLAIAIFRLIARNVKKKNSMQNSQTNIMEDMGNLNDYLSSDIIAESKNDKVLESFSDYKINAEETKINESEEMEDRELKTTKASNSNTFEVESKSSPYDDYMKLPKGISEESNANERLSDVKYSPYFTTHDWYNAVSNSNLCILSKFKTSQAKSNADNASEVLRMIANYYEIADDFNMDMFNRVKEQHASLHTGICVNQMEELLSEMGLEYKDNDSSEANLESVRKFLENESPVIVGLNRWGCSWSIIIGYDDMGTDDFGDDIVILADSTDISDHCQDGYMVMHALEFLNYWNFRDIFKNEMNAQDKAMNCFIAVTGYKSRKVE